MSTLARKARKKWTCSDPACRHVQYVKTSSRRCERCGNVTKPPPRQTKAKPKELYPVFVRVNGEIHGCGEECGACGKLPSEGRKNDRDHDHNTGLPRGLLCPGHSGCNIMLAKWIDSKTAFAIAAAKRDKQQEHRRWTLLGEYLARSEAFYASH